MKIEHYCILSRKIFLMGFWLCVCNLAFSEDRISGDRIEFLKKEAVSQDFNRTNAAVFELIESNQLEIIYEIFQELTFSNQRVAVQSLVESRKTTLQLDKLILAFYKYRMLWIDDDLYEEVTGRDVATQLCLKYLSSKYKVPIRDYSLQSPQSEICHVLAEAASKLEAVIDYVSQTSNDLPPSGKGAADAVLDNSDDRKVTQPVNPVGDPSTEGSPDPSNNRWWSPQVDPLSLEIKPDANMAGVIGDTVPSRVPGSRVKHFVTPKQTPELNQPDVILRASGITAAELTPGHADQLLAWEVTPATNRQADDNPLLCRIKRGTVGMTEVKLKTKAGNQVLAQTNVWVVWATGATPVEIPVTSTLNLAPVPGITVRGGYNFTFNVQPAILFSNAERPKFGPREGILPGENLNGMALDGGAKGRWDVSRQIRGKYVGMGSYMGVLSITDQLDSAFPSNPIDGNDDANSEDETSNPEASGGNLTSRGVPSRGWSDYLRPAPPDIPSIVWKLHFREFTRLQIGPKWYLISEYQLWRLHVQLSFDNRIWNNTGSEVKMDHSDW